eukprot:Hpha_TRINITY_DN15914_c0_g5::TRINITY_DN15914_c0_g5_i1::g.73064::m.73064
MDERKRKREEEEELLERLKKENEEMKVQLAAQESITTLRAEMGRLVERQQAIEHLTGQVTAKLADQQKEAELKAKLAEEEMMHRVKEAELKGEFLAKEAELNAKIAAKDLSIVTLREALAVKDKLLRAKEAELQAKARARAPRADRRAAEEVIEQPTDAGRSGRGGLLVFATIEPPCARPSAVDQLVPVEVEPTAVVQNLITELVKMDAVRGGVEVEWHERRLAPNELLADVGMCPESRFRVVPSVWLYRCTIGAGTEHSAAILPSGKVACWGGNTSKQINVPLISSRVMSLSCRSELTACVLEDKSVIGWGETMCQWQKHSMADYKFDAGSIDDFDLSAPPRVGGSTVQVSLGDDCKYVCLKEGGKAEFIGWESGWTKQLQWMPANMGPVIQVAAGVKHFAAVLVDGTVRCWGDDGCSQCKVPPLCGTVMQVSCGHSHTVAVFRSGEIRCWGDNTDGVSFPPEFGMGVQQVAAGSRHNVALLDDGTVRCWGGNQEGQCDVPPLHCKAVQVSAGSLHSVALMEDGSVLCWGCGVDGQCTAPPLDGKRLSPRWR